MKKQITCLTLALSLAWGGTAWAAFSDITDPDTAQAAASLDALSIMQGVGGGKFEPARSLTRAEFTKLAVTAMGVPDVTAYRSYTLFPDVLYTHWASGYIAATAKHPDLAKKQIIRGNADGTFTPEKTVTYGEACTMLLRMLDYTVADVGPVWPADYIAKAQSLGLNSGLPAKDANAPITRAEAAVLLRNTLRTPTKDGEKLYAALSGGTPVENSILLATAETDPGLPAGQLRFYENGEIVNRPAAGSLDAALVGARGTVLFDKTATAKVRSFLPEVSDRVTYTVVRAERQQLVTDSGSINVGRKVPVVAEGELHDYIEAWFDILPGEKVNLYYDKDHNLELIAVDASFIQGDSYVWGVDDCAIPKGYRIERNGSTISVSDLKKYDVVTLKPSTQTALVSNARITGLYEDASPSFRFPDKVKVLSTEFAVSEIAAPTFDTAELGKKLTLLFDVNGHVRAAVPASELSTQMTGIMTACTENKVTVRLFNGQSIEGPVEKPVRDAIVGQMVRLYQTMDGYLHVVAEEKNGKNYGDWIVSRGVLGSSPVAPDVQVFERVSDDAPMYQLNLSEIGVETVSSKDIETVITDGAGTVVAIVMGDVTGEGWIWGAVKGASTVTYREIGDPDSPDYQRIPIYDYKVQIQYLDSEGKPQTVTLDVDDQVKDLAGKPTPLALPRAALSNTGEMKLASKKPIRVGTVGLTAFDGYDGVRTDKGYYRLADNLPVYVTRLDKVVTLRQAKADYDNFTLYADKTAENGGMIRMVTVN